MRQAVLMPSRGPPPPRQSMLCSVRRGWLPWPASCSSGKSMLPHDGQAALKREQGILKAVGWRNHNAAEANHAQAHSGGSAERTAPAALQGRSQQAPRRKENSRGSNGSPCAARPLAFDYSAAAAASPMRGRSTPAWYLEQSRPRMDACSASAVVCSRSRTPAPKSCPATSSR